MTDEEKRHDGKRSSGGSHWWAGRMTESVVSAAAKSPLVDETLLPARTNIVMAGPENPAAESAIAPVATRPARTGLRNDRCANETGYQYGAVRQLYPI